MEVLANSIDEHLAGRCTRIDVEIGRDGSIVVEDDGRGFPVHEVDGLSFAERAFTSPHSTPTRDGHAPHAHLSFHGVGIFAVCALSQWLTLDAFRDGNRYTQRFERGLAASRLCAIERANRTGTRIAFAPDPAIFRSTWLDPGPVVGWLKEISYLLPGLTLSFADRREHHFCEPAGLVAYVESKARGDADRSRILRVSDVVGEIFVEAAAGWGPFPWSSLESFANVERTTEGGTHVRGFLLGLVAGLKVATPEDCARRTTEQIEHAASSGLNGIVCVRLADPSYGAPTKARLVTPEARAAVKQSVSTAFIEFLGCHPELRDRIIAALRDAG